jgi:hypothetical protein
MKRVNIIAVAIILSLLLVAVGLLAQPQINPAAVLVPNPCLTQSVAPQSAVISVAAAGTSALVPVSGTTSVYVCGFSFTLPSIMTTAATAAIEYGSGTACATSPTAMTGTYGGGGIVSGNNITVNQSTPLAKTPSGNGVCLVAAGTTVSVQGVLSYVQQ